MCARFAGGVVTRWHVLDVEVFEKIIEQLVNMCGDGLLAKLGDIDARRLNGPFGTAYHLVEHIRCREIVPWRRLFAVILGKYIAPLPGWYAALRQE